MNFDMMHPDWMKWCTRIADDSGVRYELHELAASPDFVVSTVMTAMLNEGFKIIPPEPSDS